MGLVNLVYADTFSPAAAPPGGTVTLSGQARPNSSMSGYFSCNGGCGQTHIGVATVNTQGLYTLTFKIPASAKLGGAFVDIGCDNCGNNWRRVTGLQVQAGEQSQAGEQNISPESARNKYSKGRKQREELLKKVIDNINQPSPVPPPP